MFRSEPLPIGYSIPKGYKRKRPADSPTNIRLKRQNPKGAASVLLHYTITLYYIILHIHILTITHKEITEGQATAARTKHQAPCANFN